MNPRKIKPYQKAFRLVQEQRDAEMWRMGIYVQSAVSVAVEHNLAGSKAKSKYIEEPILISAHKEKDMSAKEKLNQTELFFARLNAMKANFELENKINSNIDEVQNGND